MAEKYARYGLAGNPFVPVLPLNPRENPEDMNRVARLVRFKLEDIDNILQNKIAARQPAFFLVSGKDGTGRTSVANYILTNYCRFRGNEKLIVPEMEVNHSVEDVFRNWMLRLLTELELANIDIGGELFNSISDQAQTTPPSLLSSKFQILAVKASKALDPLQACFGIYLENIPDLDLFEAARDIFKHSPTVCVMTISDSILAKIQKRLPAEHTHIALEEIEGPDVWEVIKKRWTGHKPIPFDQNGVVKAFSQKITIARAIVLTGKLLANMLDFHPHGEEWPTATELRFNEDLIINQINTQSTPEWGHRGTQ